jgi:hypothetical protein
LFAKTNKTIEIAGRNIPIPFSETKVPPDKFSERYTKNPSKIKLNIMFNLFNTNCRCLSLKLKIFINVNPETEINSIIAN